MHAMLLSNMACIVPNMATAARCANAQSNHFHSQASKPTVTHIVVSSENAILLTVGNDMRYMYGIPSIALSRQLKIRKQRAIS